MSFTRLTTSPDGVGDKLAAASGRVTSVGFFVCGKKAWRLAYSLVWERRRVCVCRQRAAQAGVALESLPGDQRRAVSLRGLPMQLSQMKADFFKRPVILQLRQKEHCFAVPPPPSPWSDSRKSHLFRNTQFRSMY